MSPLTERPPVAEWYLSIAAAVSRRGECTRRKVGAVIVKDSSIVSTGVNGAPPGEPSCLHGACPRAASDAEPGKDYAATGCVVIHAEVNALLRATWNEMQGATLYCTDEPCESCQPLLRAAGISMAVWGRDHAEGWIRFGKKPRVVMD